MEERNKIKKPSFDRSEIMAHIQDSKQQSNKFLTSFSKEILPAPCHQKQKQPKKYVETIDKLLRKTSGTTAISELRDEDVIVKNQIQIVEKINEHFVNVGPELAKT